jgi:sacsin
MPRAFGQQQKITTTLNRICNDYMHDTQILKEQLQNADDAGATRVAFTFDKRRSLGTTALVDPRMAPWAGPAVMFSQDAIFEAEDFSSIMSVGDSRKKFDVTKTGKFGVGFNACYHLTDVPSFISGRSLVHLDPHDLYASAGPGQAGTWEENLLEGAGTVDKLSDSLCGFDGHGATIDGVQRAGRIVQMLKQGKGIPGTVFRFPLRTKKLARASEICRRPFSEEDAMGVSPHTYTHTHTHTTIVFNPCNTDFPSLSTISSSSEVSTTRPRSFCFFSSPWRPFPSGCGRTALRLRCSFTRAVVNRR